MDGAQLAVLQPQDSATLSQVQAQLEAAMAVPPLHELRLFQGTRELLDGSVLEVEVQAFQTPSPNKAIVELERVLRDSEYMNIWLDEEAEEAAVPAVAVLEDAEDLAPAQSERLIAILQKTGHLLRAHLRYRFGAAFGRTCANPSLYVPRLMERGKLLSSVLVLFSYFGNFSLNFKIV